MNSYQIDTVLNLSLSKIHGGVYPADRLPEIPNTFDRPKAFVANTDNHDFPGQHWVAFYFPSKGPSEYFDSYGLPPDRKSTRLNSSHNRESRMPSSA